MPDYAAKSKPDHTAMIKPAVAAGIKRECTQLESSQKMQLGSCMQLGSSPTACCKNKPDLTTTIKPNCTRSRSDQTRARLCSKINLVFAAKPKPKAAATMIKPDCAAKIKPSYAAKTKYRKCSWDEARLHAAGITPAIKPRSCQIVQPDSCQQCSWDQSQIEQQGSKPTVYS